MLEDTPVWKTYIADGVQKQWDFDLPYIDGSSIKLYISHEGVLKEIGAALFKFDETTKKVTYPIDASPAIPQGDIVLIWRQTEVTQEEDSTHMAFKSSDIEYMVDKLTAICQELKDAQSRSVSFDPTEMPTGEDINAAEYIALLQKYKDASELAATNAAESEVNSKASEMSAEASAASAEEDKIASEAATNAINAVDQKVIDAVDSANRAQQASAETLANATKAETAADIATTKAAEAAQSAEDAAEAAQNLKHATETTYGTARLATQTEALGGTNNEAAMTPLKTKQAIDKNIAGKADKTYVDSKLATKADLVNGKIPEGQLPTGSDRAYTKDNLVAGSNVTFEQGLYPVDSHTLGLWHFNTENNVDNEIKDNSYTITGLRPQTGWNEQKRFGACSFKYPEFTIAAKPSGGEFTVDFWFYGDREEGSRFDFTAYEIVLGIRSNHTIKYGPLGYEPSRDTGIVLKPQTWTHIAVVKKNMDGGTLYLFVNGVKCGEMYSSEVTYPSTDFVQSSGPTFGTFLDELRISDIARYTDNFSVPFAEYGGTSSVTGVSVDLSGMVSKSGSTMTGPLTVPDVSSGSNDNTVINSKWANSKFVGKAGGTMTGALKLPAPSASLSDNTAVTAAWVRTFVNSLIGDTGGGVVVPVGALIMGPVDSMAGYLLCDGQAVSRTQYSALFAAIGTNFGAGDGSNTFNVPDYRGCFLRMAGGSAGTMYQKQPQGLPDITGEFDLEGGSLANGAFKNNGTHSQLHDGWKYSNNKIVLSAATSNSIYGAANEVRPVNFAVNYFIKY